MGIWIAAAIAAFAATPLLGQPAGRAALRERLLQALDLTHAQRQALVDLRDRLQAALDEIAAQVEDGQVAPEKTRLHQGAALQAYREARDSVLTPAQLGLLARARRHLRDEQLADGGARADGSERLVDALQLTTAQKRRWRALLQSQRQEVWALAAAGTTPSTADLRRLREEHRLRFEAILTDPQRQELEDLRRHRYGRQVQPDAAGRDLHEDAGAELDEAWDDESAADAADVPREGAAP